MGKMAWAITESGYNVFQLLSALQKDIRRGNEEQALFWAIQLERYNYRMLWRRLEIIASEDIGLANPTMPVMIHTLKQQYYDVVGESKSDSYRLFLANAILQLCRSEKSRLVDDTVWKTYWEYYNGIKYPIPDYARQPHSCTNMSDEEFESWYETVFKLENEANNILNPYRNQAKENKLKSNNLPKIFPLKKNSIKKPHDLKMIFEMNGSKSQ